MNCTDTGKYRRLQQAGKALAATTAAACLTLTNVSAALALTDSGPVSCGANIVAVRGEQQLYGNRLTLKVNTQVVYDQHNVYSVVRSSTLTGNKTWYGTSNSLHYDGTYGMCLPPGS
ncbi:MAG: hypothetical protein GX555_03825 [Actinomycetales bacterium]|nr:hypothetical protein [Actinomycetales bacterium]